MLYNQQGQQVNVDKKYNSNDHAHIFFNLREKHENKDGHKHPMFRLDQRAVVK